MRRRKAVRFAAGACALALTALAISRARAAEAVRDSAAAPLAFTKTVFATAKDIPNPVAFTIDEHGVVFTADALRYDGRGLFDYRAFPAIRDDDATSRSVEDRRRLTEQWVKDGRLDHDGRKVTLDWLSQFSEQVRRLEDTDGDGRADRVDVWADGMNELTRGAAAGVLAYDGRVYATIIPELLAFRDSAGTAARTVLQGGFGIHMGQGGHDMHGLAMGNDGRLYWSIADRGFSFTTREGRHYEGHTGAVFRCWPDGTGLELYARGFRNPQELAFDDHGDLFTGDNNADIGDPSRVLYIPEGADAGWLYSLQSMPGCGPWTREHLCEKRFAANDPAQPAWVLTPVDYAGSCPSGFAAYPGTGLPPRYDGSLWLVDFLGGVRAMHLAPRGASFETRDVEDAFHESWGICDFDFGYDGRLWALYWGENWRPNDHARLVALTPHAAGIDTAAVAEVKRLVSGGFGSLDGDRLAELLGHADRRVRQRASFELARRGDDRRLAAALAHAANPLARLHALWGLGIVGARRGAEPVLAPVTAALSDRDPEVRRVAAFTLGELGAPASARALVRALADPSARVRFAAAQALARVGDAGSIEPLIAALAANGDDDAMLRFAYARALARAAEPARLVALNSHADRAVRLGAVLALRERGGAEVAAFLADRDDAIAIEAARAAYDRESPAAMAALAASLPGLRAGLCVEPYLRRALHAALRLGGAAQAEAVAAFAAEPGTAPEWRDEALRVLAQWDAPDPHDGVWGRWEPQPARAAGGAHAALAAHLGGVLEEARGPALGVAIALARAEKVTLGNSILLRWVRDETQNDFARVTALRWLAARGAPETNDGVTAALGSRSDSLFAAGLEMTLGRDPSAATAAAERAFRSADTPLGVRQAAVRGLANSVDPGPAHFLAARFGELTRGALDPRLGVDVLMAARAALVPELRDSAAAWDARAATGGPLAPYLLAMHGGDARRGRVVFATQPAAQCVRCHSVDGNGGTVGPDLSGAGAHDRAYLLAALVTPSATFAKGFEPVTLTLRDGRAIGGFVRSESADSITLAVDGRMRTLPRAAVRRRVRGDSPMPPMGEVLSLDQMRDVIEYLSTLREFTPDLPIDSLTAEIATTGFGRVGLGRSCTDNPLRVADRTFARGVGVHAPSRLVYAVPPGVSAFVARVGLDDEAAGGLADFEVLVDGVRAWVSEPMRRGQIARVHVAVPAGARRVELRVGDAGNGTNGDHADWLNAGFVR